MILWHDGMSADSRFSLLIWLKCPWIHKTAGKPKVSNEQKNTTSFSLGTIWSQNGFSQHPWNLCKCMYEFIYHLHGSPTVSSGSGWEWKKKVKSLMLSVSYVYTSGPVGVFFFRFYLFFKSQQNYLRIRHQRNIIFVTWSNGSKSKTLRKN